MTGNLQEHHILVTGAAGFLGRQLVTYLMKTGAKIIGIDKRAISFETSSSKLEFENYSHLQSGIESSLDQARDFLSSVSLNRRGVFHCAGIAEAGRCQQDPDQAFNLNVKLTWQILELCRQIGGARFIFPSTGLVYGDKLERPATETDAVYASTVYASTKLSAEALVQEYAVNFSCSATVARLSNVYGPNVSEKTVVGKIIKQIQNRHKLQIRDERPIRDFVFSGDVVEALTRLYLHSAKESFNIINVSSGKATATGHVMEIASKIFSLERLAPELELTNSGEISYMVLSNKKLKKIVGWQPPTTLTEGLNASLTKKGRQ